MENGNEYFSYLQRRSKIGLLYRKYWLYPRLCRHLNGLTLDVGCGIGDMLEFRRETVGVDINVNTVSYCLSRGLNAKVMEPNRLPFPSEHFDSVILDNVLEHIVDPTPLLLEVRRVLRNGGVLLVGVPGIRGWDADPDHKVAYDEETLLARFDGLKFKHNKIFYAPLWRSDWLSRNVRQYCIYAKFLCI